METKNQRALEILPKPFKALDAACNALGAEWTVYHIFNKVGEVEIQVNVQFAEAEKITGVTEDPLLQAFLIAMHTAYGESDCEYKHQYGEFIFQHDATNISFSGGHGLNGGTERGNGSAISFRVSNNPGYIMVV